MFLTSQLYKFLNTSPTQKLAPASECTPTSPFDVDGDGELQEANLSTRELERRKRQDDMEVEEEEEARPPYLHV